MGVFPADERGGPTGRNPGESAHSLALQNRQRATMEGVLHVESFDDRQILLDTALGSLMLRGEQLQIRQFDLERGRFEVEGTIHALQYGPPLRGKDGARARSGWLQRLLR